MTPTQVKGNSCTVIGKKKQTITVQIKDYGNLQYYRSKVNYIYIYIWAM